MPSPSGTNWVTSDDIVYKALDNLGVTAAGQSTDPEDYQKAAVEIQPMFNELAALEICYLPDLSNIPAAWSRPLGDILAGICAPKFGATDDAHVRWVTMGLGGPPSGVPLGGGAAALSLKQQLRGRPTGEPVRTFYF